MFRCREQMWDESDGGDRIWTTDRNCGEIQSPSFHSTLLRHCFVYEVISRLYTKKKRIAQRRIYNARGVAENILPSRLKITGSPFARLFLANPTVLENSRSLPKLSCAHLGTKFSSNITPKMNSPFRLIASP